MLRTLLWAGGLSLAGLLGMGYWQSRTKGWLQVVAADPSPGRYRVEGPIGLVFFNGAGERLAKAALDESGVLGFEGEYAECAEAARRPAGSAGQPSWTDCFDRLSRWIPRWGREVRAVEVTLPGCGPVRVETRLGRSSGDWWLWWVPLPHVGGTPYSTYSLLLEVKARQCQARALTPAGG